MPLQEKSLSESPIELSEHQKLQIQNFICKTSELAYDAFKAVLVKGELNLSSWNHLSGNIIECWRLIRMIRSFGIKVNCLSEPIDFRVAFPICTLASYLMPDNSTEQ